MTYQPIILIQLDPIETEARIFGLRIVLNVKKKKSAKHALDLIRDRILYE